MKKRLQIPFFIIAIIGIVLSIYMLIKNDVITFSALYSEEQIEKKTNSVDKLTEGKYYVWHNSKTDDIQKDLQAENDTDVFLLCPAGDPNWSKDSFVKHTLWFTSTNDQEIPTIYPGDKLLYISSSEVPFKGISWERYCDYGYSIGAANLIGDESGHYHITSDDGSSFRGYLYEKSDTADLNQYVSVTNLFLDKVGGTPIRQNSISDGGTVINLKKDKEYICEWYSGTYYQDYKMVANIHPFSFLEEFQTYDYDFLHSNVIEIKIPQWFKTGYYYINNIGMVRYVTDEFSSVYNGEPYDSNVVWNDPIILYDEYGNLIYDPSTKTDRRDDVGTGKSSTRSKKSNGVNQHTEEEIVQSQKMDGDGGADMYDVNEDVEFTGDVTG